MNIARIMLPLIFLIPVTTFAMDVEKKKKYDADCQKTLNICLDQAIEAGQLPRVQDLLYQKADANAVLTNGDSPLTLAARNDKQAIVMHLLLCGADDTRANFHTMCDDDNMLLETRKKKLTKTYKKYLKKVNAEIAKTWHLLPKGIVTLICSKMWVTEDDRALGRALIKGEKNTVETLLRTGADVNFWCFRGPALYLAARCEKLEDNAKEEPYQKQLDMMKLLLDNRANPDQGSYAYRWGKTANQPVLYELAEENCASRVALLLAYKANTELVDGDGKKFADYAQEHKRVMDVWNAAKQKTIK